MSVPAGQYRFDSPKRISFVSAVFIIGTLGSLITPALLEAWSKLHWTQTELGAVTAIELAAMTAGSLSGLYWQRRWNWRRITVISLLLVASANVACVVLEDFTAVCICRGVSGLGGGLMCAVYSAFVANAKQPGRIIAVTNFFQIAVEAVLVFSTTALFDLLGSTGLFIVLAVLLLILIPFSKACPIGWPPGGDVASDASIVTHSLRGYPILLSFLPYVVVQTGMYTFLGEFGRISAHLDVPQTLHAVGISIILSSLGSVAAYTLSDRIGLRVPIATSVALIAASICAMVLASTTSTAFLVYISLLQIAWIFLNCYLYSALIEANNLLVPAAIPLAAGGGALGASAIGYALEHGGPAGCLRLSVAAMLATALLTLPFLKR